MPKSLTIDDAESKVSCDDLASLQAKYQQAVRDFAKGVKKVRGAKAVKPTLNAPPMLSDPGRVRCESAHRALRNHIIEHGCC